MAWSIGLRQRGRLALTGDKAFLTTPAGLRTEVLKLRADVVAAARTDSADKFDSALRALEDKQQALGRVSRDYNNRLLVQSASMDDVQSALSSMPRETVLIEFRQFRPVDFKTGKLGEPRFAALLLVGSENPLVTDVGLAQLIDYCSC